MASSRLRKVRGSHNALDMDTESVASRAMQRENENSIRLCQRIWSGYTKFIRSQCNKDRVIDSMFFGSFFKREEKLDDVGEDMKKNTSNYGFIADIKKQATYSEFKLVQNQENYASGSKAKVDQKE